MRNLVIIFTFLFAVISCGSLSEVNTLANKSSESLEKYKDLNYTFSSNCHDKCYQRALEDENFTIEAPTCDCTVQKKADKNVAILFKALSTYFKGLHQLSDNKLIEFSKKSDLCMIY